MPRRRTLARTMRYEIDANGRIFVEYGGLDNTGYEIIDLEDIQKHFPGVIVK